MTDLSHWKFKKEFTPREIASLILGLEPSEAKVEQIYPVIHRLKEDFSRFIKNLQTKLAASDDDIEYGSELQSSRIKRTLEENLTNENKSYYCEWLDKELKDFEVQTFSSSDVAQWESSVESHLHFKHSFIESTKSCGPEEEHKRTKWPWGEYETKNLLMLEAVVRKFWASYDRSKPNKAPMNKEIIHWLETEHGMSNNIASAVATILKAEEVKTGPRK